MAALLLIAAPAESRLAIVCERQRLSVPNGMTAVLHLGAAAMLLSTCKPHAVSHKLRIVPRRFKQPG